ncbi:MAG: Rieske (2Fe-2S) protein [Cuniculiplasma sp.]
MNIITTRDGFDSKGRKRIQQQNRDITILQLEGKFYAFDSQCPHRGGPMFLCKYIKNKGIMCPSHHIIFKLEGGEILENPIPVSMGDYSHSENLKTYGIIEREKDLEIII